jgi:succinate dehydrogenase flavin-adding protein (antitoxin of CptAB toxin-antitoxin module)
VQKTCRIITKSFELFFDSAFKEVYDRFKTFLEEDDARLFYPLLANMDPEDWEDASAYEGKP